MLKRVANASVVSSRSSIFTHLPLKESVCAGSVVLNEV